MKTILGITIVLFLLVAPSAVADPRVRGQCVWIDENDYDPICGYKSCGSSDSAQVCAKAGSDTKVCAINTNAGGSAVYVICVGHDEECIVYTAQDSSQPRNCS